MLKLEQRVVEKNLDLFNSLIDEDANYLSVKNGDILPMDYINKAFPRFVSKKVNKEILMNESSIDIPFWERDANLYSALDLIDEFDVVTDEDLITFENLYNTSIGLSYLSAKFGGLEFVDNLNYKILDNMLGVGYLAGEISSDEFNIDLKVLDDQLIEQQSILADCIAVCSIDYKAGLESLLENTEYAVLNSEPWYLPFLKEKAKRVGNFIIQSGYDGKFD